MDSLDALRQAIEKVFQSWEDFTSGPLSRFRVVPVLDHLHDRYVLQDVDPTEDRFRSKTLAHLEIRDGKIWILTDNTEEGIATELCSGKACRISKSCLLSILLRFVKSAILPSLDSA